MLMHDIKTAICETQIMLLIQKHCNSGELWFKFKYYTKDFINPQDMPA